MYNIEFSNNAAKILENIFKSDHKLYSRVITAIESLAENPFKGKSLKGEFKGDYSLRIGDYRVVYTVYKKQVMIYIIDLGHRKNIYR